MVRREGHPYLLVKMSEKYGTRWNICNKAKVRRCVCVCGGGGGSPLPSIVQMSEKYGTRWNICNKTKVRRCVCVGGGGGGDFPHFPCIGIYCGNGPVPFQSPTQTAFPTGPLPFQSPTQTAFPNGPNWGHTALVPYGRGRSRNFQKAVWYNLLYRQVLDKVFVSVYAITE